MAESGLEREIGALQATISIVVDTLKTQSQTHERMLREYHNEHKESIRKLEDEYDKVNNRFSDVLTQINKDIEIVRDETKKMKSLVDNAKNGWKLLVGAVTISATIGAAIAKIASYFGVIPR
jgi:hypothetical protein